MADSDETTTPRKRRARSTAKKTTKKAAKKTAKKATKQAAKATKKSTKKTTKTSSTRAAEANVEKAAQEATTQPATVDRSQLGEKTRVFVLAKMLGMTSKDLVVKLNELGLVKVAQSSLSKAETEQVLSLIHI